MKYDLSKVPRPLHLPTLKCFVTAHPRTWAVVIGDNSFSTVVARASSRQEIDAVWKEVCDVLKAHRVLAGTTTFFDHVTTA